MAATVRQMRADPFDDLTASTVREVLTAKGWTGLDLDPAGLALDLGEMLLVVATGKLGEKALVKLCGAHGDLPPAPSFLDMPRGADAEMRAVKVFRRPVGGIVPHAPNLHGAVAGMSVLTIGREIVPPSVKGGHLMRWRPDAHPSSLRVPELPAWLVEMCRDPAAAHRAWGTSRPSKDTVKVLAEWEQGLTRSRGRTINTFGNLCKIFRHCPEFSGRLALNDMTQAVEFEGKPMPEGRIGAMRERIEDAPWGGFGPSETACMQAIRTVAEERRYHPVKEYLSGLKWDKTKRLDAVAFQVLHAKEAPLVRETVRKWFVSAVARALNPGCKVDTALVLVGAQGLRKSTFFYELAPKWFGDTEIKIGDKDAYGQIHANWITEWGELDRVTDQRHAGEVKAFVSRRADDFRPPYGRTTQRFERSCVMVGSTNTPQFLNDPTGARRFWCVTVSKTVDVELLRAWRDQLWAEAVEAHRAGELHYFEEADEAIRAQDVDRHRRRHPWEEKLSTWIEERWPAVSREKNLKWLTTGVLLEHALSLSARDMTQGTSDTVGKCMAVLGYESKQRRPKRDEGLYRKPSGEVLTRINVWLKADEPDEEPAETSTRPPDPPAPTWSDHPVSDAEDGYIPCQS